MPDRLDPLQLRVVRVLAPMRPEWTLTGGGALAAVHLGHRVTYDLDLFWHGRSTLEAIGGDAESRLVDDGLAVEPIQTSPNFRRLRVSLESQSIVVDLAAR